MFRNRGPMPNIPNNNGGFNLPHYSHFWRGRYIIIRYDKTFMLMELMSFLLIAIIIAAALFWGYPITFEDPIAEMKENFLNSQLIMIGISLISIAIVTIFSREQKNLANGLKIIAIITMVMIMGQLIIKSNIDNKYNKDVFGQFYEQIDPDSNKSDKKVSLEMSGMSLKSAKESYIQKSVDAFNNFKMKTTLYILVHLIVEVVIVFLLYRLKISEIQRQKLAKDDIILEDAEQNIRY